MNFYLTFLAAIYRMGLDDRKLLQYRFAHCLINKIEQLNNK